MSQGRYSGHITFAVATAVMLAACSADTPTSPAAASVSLTAAPTIAISPLPYVIRVYGLCYPPYGGNRPCPSSISVTISNTGGGTLNWTSSKSATWLRRSPTSGTAPSTMKISVDGTGLPPGTYTGWIKVWAKGATNSPQTVTVKMRRL
jgi:BACON domain-containing protein